MKTKTLSRIAAALLVAASLVPLVAIPASAGPAAPFLPGIRPLGMGNAFVAVADDRNALHYNPAGLARIARNRAISRWRREHERRDRERTAAVSRQ